MIFRLARIIAHWINAGMSPKTREAAEKGLPNALFTVTYDKERLIGMGRVIGDGGTVFQIVDVAVLKSYQGQGYGSQIMEHIMKYIKMWLSKAPT